MALKNTALKNTNTYDDRFKTILFKTNSDTNICDSPRVEKLNIRCWENNLLQSTILGVRGETKRFNFPSLYFKNRNRQFALFFAVIIVFETHVFSQKYHCRSIDIEIIIQKRSWMTASKNINHNQSYEYSHSVSVNVS